MEGDSLTLQEAAELLGKSTQTVRRLIKKGELQAEQSQTPQGFQYVVSRSSLAQRFPRLRIMTEDSPKEMPTQAAPPVETLPPTLPSSALPPQKNSDPWADFLENDHYIVEPTQRPEAVSQETVSQRELLELIQLAHKEKLMLITILERLQAELIASQRRPKTFFQWIRGVWKSFQKGQDL